MWTLTLTIAALAAADAVAGHAPARTVASWCAPVLRPLTSRFGSSVNWFRTLRRLQDLASENAELRDERTRALAAESALADARSEAAFLRQVAGLEQPLRASAREASIFTYGAGAGREAILDRGSDDGVVRGDVVITAAGALVGRVEQTGDAWAAVRLLSDVSLEVTGHILETETGGLVRTDPMEGLVMDLINKDEPVTEGQTVVTSGDDRFPAGIVIGTVRSVDRERTTLFALVRLSPTVSIPVRGAVLVITP